MKFFVKFLVFNLLLGILFSFAPRVSASITFPECRWYEITKSCECPHDPHSCADNSCSACLEYKNDPRYRFLWKDIYCRNASLLEFIDKYKYPFFIPFFTALVLDLAVFIIRGFRKKKELLVAILINCAAQFAGIGLLGIIPKLVNEIFTLLRVPNIPFILYGMDVPRMVSLLLIWAIITYAEVLFWVRFTRTYDKKYVTSTIVIANAVSLILGIGILNAIYPHFLQPRLF